MRRHKRPLSPLVSPKPAPLSTPKRPPLTGLTLSGRDRLELVLSSGRQQVTRLLGSAAVGAAGAGGIAEVAGAPAWLTVLAAAGGASLGIWVRLPLSRYLHGLERRQLELDLPRRQRAVASTRQGEAWATDVVPARGRLAVLLLHYAPTPAEDLVHPAHGLPDEPWAAPTDTAGGRRVCVAFAWADSPEEAELKRAEFTTRARALSSASS